MIEELIKVLKHNLQSNIRLTKVNLIDIIKIFEYYNNINLDKVNFDDFNKFECYFYVRDDSNGIILNNNILDMQVEKFYSYFKDKFNFTIDEFYNYFYLYTLFHELTHAKQYNLSKENELNKKIWNLNNKYVEQFNKLYLNGNHDLLTIEREANLDGWYLTNIIAKNLSNSDIIEFTSFIFFKYLFRGYTYCYSKTKHQPHNPMDLFISKIPKRNKLRIEFYFLKRNLINEYPDINYEHFKYGLEISNDDFIKLNNILYSIFNGKFDRQEDLKKIIKL